MKRSAFYFLATSFIFFGLSGCSSTSESADTAVTTETVTPDVATNSKNTNPVTGAEIDTTAATAALSEDPTNFVLLAGSLDLLQTRTSNQAVAKASNAEVRTYAQEVLSDHSSISRELRGMATAKNLKYPADLLAKHQLLMNRLMEERAKNFDKTYVEVQESAHKELEELFEDASKRHADPEMKEFAAKSLPALRTNLERTRKVKDIVD